MTVSLGKRIFRSFFLNSLISLLAVIAFVWFVFEDMEDDLLERNSKELLHFLQQSHSLLANHYWASDSLIVYFHPFQENDATYPPLFQNIPTPFSDEVTWQNKIYHVHSHTSEEGHYYLATDVSEFEHREFLFSMTLIALCLIVFILNIVLSIFSNRRLVKPLQQLTSQIRSSIPSHSLTPVDTDFADTELVEIAKAFNWFIHEISSFIQRERVIISSAGHELKTPIAVISGALQVIEKRGELNPADQKTFARIKQSTQHMQENIETLLTLSRRSRSRPPPQTVTINDFLDDLIDEIDFINRQDCARIERCWQAPNVKLITDTVLMRLLIRNLIRNALNHTKGAIRLFLTENYLDILDQGSGLPTAVTEWIKKPEGELPLQEGLGLYLVTLACEQLEWHLDTVKTDTWSNGLRLYFKAKNVNADG